MASRRDASLMGMKKVLPPIRGQLDGGKKLGLDWDKAEENLTTMHRYSKAQLLQSLRLRRAELNAAEEAGMENKAKKLRREINKLLEADLALTHSTCPTCHRYLNNCRCTSDPTVSRSTVARRKQKELKVLELLRWAQGWTAEEIREEQLRKGRKF